MVAGGEGVWVGLRWGKEVDGVVGECVGEGESRSERAEYSVSVEFVWCFWSLASSIVTYAWGAKWCGLLQDKLRTILLG